MFPWNVYKQPLFSPDPDSGSGDDPAPDPDGAEDTSADDGKKDWTPAQQKEFDKRAAALKKAAEEQGRIKALAEIEKKQKKDKEDADKKRMEEEGKYKELSDKATADRDAAEARALEAEKKEKASLMLVSFRDAVSDLKIEFVDAQARSDAFDFLDTDIVGDDFKGMEKAVKTLMEKRPYLFKSDTVESNGDSREKGKKPTEETDKETEKVLTSRFNIRKPR